MCVQPSESGTIIYYSVQMFAINDGEYANECSYSTVTYECARLRTNLTFI